MTAPPPLPRVSGRRTTGGVFRLTLRELWAKKVTLGLFIVSTVLWLLLTFALNLDVVDGGLAAVRIFGSEPMGTVTRTDSLTGETTTETVSEFSGISLETLVMGVEAFVGGAAYWAGTLLALFATASLLPSLLERGTVDLLLSKPIGRARLLGGHLLGVGAMAVALATYLLGMVWIVMSLKSGIWNAHFLLGIPVIVLMFGVMYSVVVLLGVAARSSALALITAYALIFASIILAFRDELEVQINPPWRQLFVGLYHLLPKFAEVTLTISQLARGQPVESWTPFASSLAFGLALYLWAFHLFSRKDY